MAGTSPGMLVVGASLPYTTGIAKPILTTTQAVGGGGGEGRVLTPMTTAMAVAASASTAKAIATVMVIALAETDASRGTIVEAFLAALEVAYTDMITATFLTVDTLTTIETLELVRSTMLASTTTVTVMWQDLGTGSGRTATTTGLITPLALVMATTPTSSGHSTAPSFLGLLTEITCFPCLN